jgi:phosphatidylserine/phosphatidylglycerophosphate/cardiolipin synthase-like enzyme
VNAAIPRPTWTGGTHPGCRGRRATSSPPLVHGTAYFSELVDVIIATRAGDLLLFTDWRGDPDERLAGPHTEVPRMLCEAATRGVLVRGLIWRSHWDRFKFSASENRHLGDEIEAAGGQCLRDMRIRAGGSHHQKMVVVRHPEDPARDVAYVGGIDLCHSRRDDARHRGDRQPQPIAPEYGEHPPWHDIQLAIRGPAVGDVEASFRERWNDPAPLSRNPIARLHDLLDHEDTHARVLPRRLPDPLPPKAKRVTAARRYRCCAPTRTGDAATRSHRTGNAASPAPTAKPSASPDR